MSYHEGSKWQEQMENKKRLETLSPKIEAKIIREYKEEPESVLDKFFSVDSKVDIEYKICQVKMILASKIKDAIDKPKLNNSQFAVLMGVRPSVVTKWLSGTHNFTIDTLIRIQEQIRVRLI